MNQNVKNLLIAAGFIIGGIIMILLSIKSNKEIKTFPEVQVTVLAVEVTYERDADGGDTRTETVYVEYTVDGKEYTDIILDSAPSNLSRGDTVTAHYNPDKPEYVTGATAKSNTILLIFGIITALVGGGSVIFKAIRGR